jgi:hypothetical protein
MVLVGKNGWLFLDQDSNRLLDQHTGQLRFSEAQLDAWQRTLDERVRRLGEMGIAYYFFVAPNKESIYIDELPDDVRSAPERPVHQLQKRLADSGSRCRLIYPVDELSAERTRRESILYMKVDTHWNSIGALVAYRCLATAIGEQFPVHVVKEDDLEVVEAIMDGDLGDKLDPQQRSLNISARVSNQRARVIRDNYVHNNGRVTVFERPDSDLATCVLFGDSFGLHLLSYLAESFSRFVYVHRPTIDYELIEREQPDVVVNESIERFIIAVPNDEAAEPTTEIVRKKKEAGRILSRELAVTADVYYRRRRGTFVATELAAQRELPALGGAHEEAALGGEVEGLFCVVPHAVALGYDEYGWSEAAAATVRAKVDGHVIRACFVMATAAVTTGDAGPTAAGHSEVGKLRIDGQEYVPSGTPNESIDLDGLELILNEQRSDGGEDLTVNALRIRRAGGTDIVVASAHASLHRTLPSEERDDDFVTGAGFMRPPLASTRASFGVVGGLYDGWPWGHFVYKDHDSGLAVASTDVTAYSGEGDTRHLEGEGVLWTRDGKGGGNVTNVSYEVALTVSDDANEPDELRLVVPDQYTVEGKVLEGRITLVSNLSAKSLSPRASGTPGSSR